MADDTKTPPPPSEAKKEEKPKDVSVKLKRHVPLATIARLQHPPGPERNKMMLDKKVAKGGRIEKGTEITVSGATAKRLKEAGYAALFALALLLPALGAGAANAQTYTAGSTVTAYQECAQYVYEGQFTAASNAVIYVSPELDIRDAERFVIRARQVDAEGAVVGRIYGPLAFLYVSSSEVGTETIDVTPEYSVDGARWVTTAKTVTDFGTTPVVDTLSVINSVVPAGWSYGRYMRLRFDPAGSTANAVITYRVIIPKREGAGCTAGAPTTSSS